MRLCLEPRVIVIGLLLVVLAVIVAVVVLLLTLCVKVCGGLYTAPHTPPESAGVCRSLPDSGGLKFQTLAV